MIPRTVSVLLTIAAAALAQAPSAYSVHEILSKSGAVQTLSIRVPSLDPGKTYSLLFSIDSPSDLQPESRIEVTLLDQQAPLATKTLHLGDPDFYAPFHVSHATGAELRVQATASSAAHYSLRINQWPDSTSLSRGSNHRWQDASPMALGRTVFASADSVDYIPLPGTPRKEAVEGAAGEDWFRFHFDGRDSKLVFFQVELMDRDDLPVDVSVYRVENGNLTPFTDGQDPVALPHEVQALPGNKFAPRILRDAGDYYVRVRANEPEYKLVTRLYAPPPYKDPHEAVRTAVDYILAAGDSWFANTPRRGGRLDRVSSVHQETSLCVACHVSHFSQRAQLYAAVNGYPVVQREELRFLSDRFYNNPRPFYGFEQEGAVWARVISAPANVLSRMSHLMDVFESQVSREPRPAYHHGINAYLNLYYAGRTQLPPDETNGNTPLVSDFEVAWYSWKETKDARLPGMIASAEVKNTIDLCYQTLALADIDTVTYKDQLAKNAEQILSLQRADGQWSMRFDPKEPEVEFQTGHALWALAAAGVPRDNPQVRKGLDYLLNRQQEFGGWFDPLQSFENFRTPFRETQFAVLALSSYYPGADKTKGWNSPAPANLSKDPVQLLEDLDRVWDGASPTLARQIEAASRSNDVLIRKAAAEALGRLGDPASAAPLAALLGDSSKFVQRAAAWSLRQIYTRHDDAPEPTRAPLLAALASPNSRVRWGATRVFAHHFATLARRGEMVAALEKLSSDASIPVRMDAVKALWQAWFWNADPKIRGQIEDTVLAGMAEPQHPWIGENLSAALYNLADENIRYLYNNWVTLLGNDQDRERAIRGRLSVEGQLAEKLARVLESGPDPQKKMVLAALAEPPLRRGDIYDLGADLSKTAPLVYSRIGNDIEQIAFFGPSADRLATALLPLLNSSDAEMRRLAERASPIVRETSFAAVNRLAGYRGQSLASLTKELQSRPSAADVVSVMRPPATGPAKPPANAATRTDTAHQKKLDEPFFHAYVDPILNKKGKDGYACANCHVTHTLFNATWSTVMNVVDTATPENSLILRKPTSTADSEGVVGSGQLAHGGGVRWPKGSIEYETILQWIQGAKLDSTAGH
jgi:HEAT repeats/Squalene-hopene cyclase C-terminal domain